MVGIFLFGTAIVTFGQQGQCVLKISGLSSQQTEQVKKLTESHLQTMTELRNERRSTTSLEEKNKISAEMVSQKETHLAEMKKVLNKEQWNEFETLFQSGAGKGQGLAASNQRGNGKGQGNFNRGRGQGKSSQSFNRGRGQANFRNNPNCLRNN